MDQLVIAVIGAVLPPFVDFINRFVPNTHWRFLISLLVSFVIGAVLAFVQNGMEDVLANGTLIFAASQTVYNMWYSRSGLQEKIRG